MPARVTTLDAAQVDAYEPRILSDALKTVAGFSTYDDLGSPYKLNLSSRGFYSSPVVGLPQGVAVFLDGVRMNEPEASQVNFDLLPMDHIQRIEILSGNGSLLGRNALGGAVNLVTARGTGPTSATVEPSGGSFGAARGEAHVSGLSKRGLDWYVGGNYNREDGWRQVTGEEGYQGFLNLGQLGDMGGIRFQGFYSRDRAEPAGSLPESIFARERRLEPDRERLREALGLSRARCRPTSSSVWAGPPATIYFRRHRAERFNVNQQDDPDAFGISYNTSFGYTADYRWTTVINDRTALSLRGGVDGEVTRVNIDIFADSTKFGAEPRPDDAGAEPALGRRAFRRRRPDDRQGHALRRRALRLRAHPLRERARPDRATPPATYKRFNPRIGASVEVAPGGSLFASWGQAFRAPAVIENACADPEAPCPLPFALGDDPPLEPVKASTVEAASATRATASRSAARRTTPASRTTSSSPRSATRTRLRAAPSTASS